MKKSWMKAIAKKIRSFANKNWQPATGNYVSRATIDPPPPPRQRSQKINCQQQFLNGFEFKVIVPDEVVEITLPIKILGSFGGQLKLTYFVGEFITDRGQIIKAFKAYFKRYNTEYNNYHIQNLQHICTTNCLILYVENLNISYEILSDKNENELAESIIYFAQTAREIEKFAHAATSNKPPWTPKPKSICLYAECNARSQKHSNYCPEHQPKDWVNKLPVTNQNIPTPECNPPKPDE